MLAWHFVEDFQLSLTVSSCDLIVNQEQKVFLVTRESRQDVFSLFQLHVQTDSIRFEQSPSASIIQLAKIAAKNDNNDNMEECELKQPFCTQLWQSDRTLTLSHIRNHFPEKRIEISILNISSNGQEWHFDNEQQIVQIEIPKKINISSNSVIRLKDINFSEMRLLRIEVDSIGHVGYLHHDGNQLRIKGEHIMEEDKYGQMQKAQTLVDPDDDSEFDSLLKLLDLTSSNQHYPHLPLRPIRQADNDLFSFLNPFRIPPDKELADEPFQQVIQFADDYYLKVLSDGPSSLDIDASHAFSAHADKLLAKLDKKIHSSLSFSSSSQTFEMKAILNSKLDRLLECYLVADMLTTLMLPLQKSAENKYTSVLNVLLNGMNMDIFETQSLLHVILNRGLQNLFTKFVISLANKLKKENKREGFAVLSASNGFISPLNGTIAANLFLANKESKETARLHPSRIGQRYGRICNSKRYDYSYHWDPEVSHFGHFFLPKWTLFKRSRLAHGVKAKPIFENSSV